MTEARRSDRSAAGSPADPRAAMLSGPILGTLLRLAAPTTFVLVVQTLVGAMEVFLVGFLGTASLAGVTLVFPVFMLMVMMSNGGIGGGVAAAVARASGAGRDEDVHAIALHALALAVAFGIAFSVAVIAGGGHLYAALGGRDAALSEALSYSTWTFAGAVPIWVVNLLSSALRGRGDVRVPALVTLIGAVIVVPVSTALIFGVGPLPAFGVAGAGMAVTIYYSLAAMALVAYMRSRRSAVRLRWRDRLEPRIFRAILGVGGLSAVGMVQANLTVVLLTGAVGLFGADAIAGYGAASRLDYLLNPLLFGLGTAVLAMVGANMGAGQVDRARRVALVGAGIAAGVNTLIGLTVAFAPWLWLGLFTDDPEVLRIGSRYLQLVGPTYGFFGVGMIMYFAAQGAGRVIWPVLAGTTRLVVTALGAWGVATFEGGLAAVFGLALIGAILFGSISAGATLGSTWGPRRPERERAGAAVPGPAA